LDICLENLFLKKAIPVDFPYEISHEFFLKRIMTVAECLDGNEHGLVEIQCLSVEGLQRCN